MGFILLFPSLGRALHLNHIFSGHTIAFLLGEEVWFTVGAEGNTGLYLSIRKIEYKDSTTTVLTKRKHSSFPSLSKYVERCKDK